jgi:adenylate cyclase
MKPEDVGMVLGEEKAKSRRWQRSAIAAAIVLVLVGIAAAIWNLGLRPAPPSDEITSKSKMLIPLSEKPSIAVLPFKNLSGDPEQEYFSDGITNDIITALSKFRELFVIASNSVFVYKDKPVKVQKVNQELGARYILEGSVQRVDQKVRVNVQLIDATSGHHIWAERYDRDLKDLFAVQDEILQTIVMTLAVKIDAEERARVMRKDTKNLKAYDYVLRGREHFSRSTRVASIQAQQLFEKAIELDPSYATAYIGLGRIQLSLFLYGWTEFPDRALQKTHDLAHKALSLETSNASAHTLLGLVYRYRLQYDQAIKELERALELNPNNSRIHATLGTIMNYMSRQDDAIHMLETALRLDPRMFPGYHMHLGLAYYLKGRYNDSIGALNRGLGWYPDHVFIYIPLAAAYAQAGRLEDAESTAQIILRLRPFFEAGSFGNAFVNPADRASIADGLRKAGLQ